MLKKYLSAPINDINLLILKIKDEKFINKFIKGNKMKSNGLMLLIISELILYIACYNSSHLKNVTAIDLENYSRENGYNGCYALYDSGANNTETCTQFKLEYPYICCKVYYRIGDFSNSFCMPIANNEKAIGDVEDAFDNADDIDIACYSYPFKYSYYLFLVLIFSLILLE